MTEVVVTRFAPSPTGRLHLGNLRTALLNWLFARKHRGRFLLRFEDTDETRSSSGMVEAIREDLAWLGLAWDGEPLFQSARVEAYRETLAELSGMGAAYRCFCSESELAAERRIARARGLPPRYSGRCRKLSRAESDRRAEREPFVWRLAAHAGEGEVRVPDLLRGTVRFSRGDLDDPVLVRSDGRFTFLLPNALDDADQGITHVLRGDDHLTNSAYQVWLLERLRRSVPVYLHHGLLLAPDGGKLSKRRGATTVAELREEGWLPEAIVQALARLGHPNMPKDARSLEALAECFEPARLSGASVKWTGRELAYWQERMLETTPPERLAEWLSRWLPGVDGRLAGILRSNIVRGSDAAAFRRLVDARLPLAGDALEAAREAGAGFFEQALRCWEETSEWEGFCACLKAQSGRKGRALFLPLRAALTGALSGPSMAELCAWLGPEGVRARLESAWGQVKEAGGKS